jgi:hypothetical protein
MNLHSEKSNQTNIYHRDYNLDKRDNLSDLPQEKAVFGIFAMRNEKPVNCRFIDETDNLQQRIRELFEDPEKDGDGMVKFMQGPWIKHLIYESMPNSSNQERLEKLVQWEKEHRPRINEYGEYPNK